MTVFQMVLLLFLPLQSVRANLRLAIPAVSPAANRSVYRQSRICADLSSVCLVVASEARRRESLCLRGESSSGADNYRMQMGYGMAKTSVESLVLWPISRPMGCQ